MRRKSLTPEEVKTVIRLLDETDLSFRLISRRMKCDHSLITRINRENGLVRKLKGPAGITKEKKTVRKKFIVKDVKGGFL